MFGAFLSLFLYQPLNMYWGPRFNAMADNQIWLTGWMWAIMSVFMMAGAYLVRFALKKGKDYTFLMILVSLGIFIPIMISAKTNLLFIAFPAFLVYELARGIDKPVQQAYVNKYAEPEKRATIISFQSMVSSLGAAIGLVFFGWIAKYTSIEISWMFSAGFALILIPVYLIARKKEAIHYS
jgi:MFS family permease